MNQFNLHLQKFFDNELPHSIDAELATLGSFMLDQDGDVREKILDMISPASFFSPDHQLIFAALIDMHDRQLPVDAVTLREELQHRGQLEDVGGVEMLRQALNSVPSYRDGAHYAGIVREHHRRRYLVKAGLLSAQCAMQTTSDPLTICRKIHDESGEMLRRASLGRSRFGGAKELKTVIEQTAAGNRKSINWPFKWVSELTKSLLPASITALVGSPGDGKTFLLLQSLIFWAKTGVSCSAFMLEGARSWHLNRVLAILAGDAHLLDDFWIQENKDTVHAYAEEHHETIEAVGAMIHTTEHTDPTMPAITDWCLRESKRSRILIIDPITLAQAGKDRWVWDERFMWLSRRYMDKSGSSQIVVTHPRTNGKKGGSTSMEDMAGGAVYSRATETVMSLQKLLKPRSYHVRDSSGIDTHARANRILRILKARNGRGGGLHIAMEFHGGRLSFSELGLISKEMKSADLNEQSQSDAAETQKDTDLDLPW